MAKTKKTKKTKKPGKGHNSVSQLKGFIDRVERLNEEKQAITADTKEVFDEAKGAGFDVKIMRKVIAMRKRDAAELAAEAEQVDLYLEELEK